MRLTRSFVVLVLVGLLPASCGDDGAATDGGVPDLDDMGADGQLDGTVPFDLPKGDGGHPDVGAKLTAGQVRAGRVTGSSQLLKGIKVEGKLGDYKLYNDRVAFIIRDERWSDGYCPFGGELLDAARLGQPGSAGQSTKADSTRAAARSNHRTRFRVSPVRGSDAPSSCADDLNRGTPLVA